MATSLNGLAHGFVRELAMACRKVSVYGSDHPVGERAIDKSFFAMDEIFRFRNHINLNLHDGFLYALNIRLKQGLFTDEITRYMQILESEAVLFNRRVTMTELARFVDRLVKRVDLSSHENLLSTYLEKNNITTIEVNSERAFKLFESQKKYLGDAHSDFSVKNMALQQMGDGLKSLIDINHRAQTALDERGIDFTLSIIEYLLPEKFATLPSEDITKTLTDVARQLCTPPDDAETKANLADSYKSLYSLVNCHPRRGDIITELEHCLSTNRLPVEVAEELSTPAGAIRVVSSEQIDSLLQQLFLPGNQECGIDEYRQAFQRLLKTGQRAKATDVVLHLLESLVSTDSSVRQRALQLLVCSITLLDLLTDTDVFESVIIGVMTDLSQKRESYEYSEIIWQLLEKCRVARRFDLMARMAGAIAGRRHFDRNVVVYESMAVKKAFEGLNRHEVIEALVDHMIRADHETSRHIREVLVSIGSEEVAVQLSSIIAHPIRRVRQQSLKILSELGKSSLKVFTRILMDDTMFERGKERHELPDSKWYVIRNSIFVLGSLQDPEGVTGLRLRLNDSDVRVRREIVSALEKISGEDACDLLVLMADDPVKEIRESAVIAVGLIGTPEIVPQLFDLARRNPSVAVRVVNALGKIGGEEARAHLVRLLEDEGELSKMASGQVSIEELRIAAVKSLGNIGDSESIAALKGYEQNLPKTRKIFSKNSLLSKTITEILSRH